MSQCRRTSWLNRLYSHFHCIHKPVNQLSCHPSHSSRGRFESIDPSSPYFHPAHNALPHPSVARSRGESIPSASFRKKITRICSEPELCQVSISATTWSTNSMQQPKSFVVTAVVTLFMLVSLAMGLTTDEPSSTTTRLSSTEKQQQQPKSRDQFFFNFDLDHDHRHTPPATSTEWQDMDEAESEKLVNFVVMEIQKLKVEHKELDESVRSSTCPACSVERSW
ncbi:hypothetical protein CEXT_529811 [Caerostris extrusa]|uniref:Transmembrane protein n=1 Tax=Caerostris extrusa TaxID=172846 RepID=A0AAV4QAM2_CAEEX|nr:hypothetical protein CEXT_529811 [Caerostris extrusa]